MQTKRKMNVLVMSTMVAMTLAACGNTQNNSGQASSDKAASANAGAADSSKSAGASTPATSAPAQPEGTLTVYGALTEENGKALAQAFEAYDPKAKVSMVAAGTGALITRINSEKQAGSVHADVLLLADPTVMDGLDQQGILASYKPAEAKSLPSSLQGKNWTGAFTFHNVIIYHKGMQLPVPASWTDLTKSDYNKQLEIGDPAYSGTTLGMAGYLSNQYKWDFFKSLSQNNAAVVSSTNTVGTDVAFGRVQVGITLDSVANPLIAKGSPVGVVWPKDGAIPVPAPVSIVAGKDNALSEAFVNWLLSPDGQKEVAKLGLAPAIGSSDLVPGDTKMADVDWSKIASDRDSILSQFKSTFAK